MSIYNLIWIIPMVFTCGYMVAALLYIGGDMDDRSK